MSYTREQYDADLAELYKAASQPISNADKLWVALEIVEKRAKLAGVWGDKE